MELQDVDQVLNMRAVVEYSGNLPVIQFSKKMNFRFQSGLHFSDDDLELSYFIPARMAENRELSILLAQMGAARNGELFFMNDTVADSALYEAFSRIIGRCQSFVMDSMIIDKGKYLLSMRFNDANLPEFSDAVMHFATRVDSLTLKFLGKNPGLRPIINEMSSAGPLARIGLSIKPPRGHLEGEPFEFLGKEWVTEIRHMTKGIPISALFRTEMPLHNPDRNGFCTISGKDNLYEYQFNDRDSLFSRLHSIMYDSRIVRFGRLMHFRDGILSLQYIIPEIQLNSLLQVINGFNKEFPDWRISIKSVESCSNCQ